MLAETETDLISEYSCPNKRLKVRRTGIANTWLC